MRSIRPLQQTMKRPCPHTMSSRVSAGSSEARATVRWTSAGANHPKAHIEVLKPREVPGPGA